MLRILQYNTCNKPRTLTIQIRNMRPGVRVWNPYNESRALKMQIRNRKAIGLMFAGCNIFVTISFLSNLFSL